MGTTCRPQADTRPTSPSRSYLLWIDGVGGYLVLPGHRVSLGQVNGEAMPDIAVLADISRHHVTMQRDSEGYFLQAHRPVRVNGQPVEQCFLASGDRLTLGTTCQFAFSLPAPLSTSARLEPVSGHRLLQPVRAVLLMADTLILGPQPAAHVLVEEAPVPLILFRQGDGLALRCPGEFQIDGCVHRDRAPLEPGRIVVTHGVSFSLEETPRKEPART